MKTKRLLCLLFALVMAVSLFAGCAVKTEEKKEYMTFEEFEDATLGVLTGSEFDIQTQALFPNNEKLQFSDVANLILSVDSDKTDGFLLDSTYYSAIAWERQGYKAISSDKTHPVNFAFMLSESDMAKNIKSQLDEFITEMKTNGEMDKLAKKWFSGVRPTEFADYSSLSGDKGTISVACANSDMPLSFVSEDICRGFDVELMIAFAKEYGYKLDFHPVDFESKLGGIASNKYDIAIGGITVTDERREEMEFTVTYYESPVLMVTKGAESEGTKLSDLSGKKVGTMTGSIQAILMPELVPDAEYLEFNSISDLIAALNSNKIDAFSGEESLYASLLWQGQAVDRIDEPLASSNYGIIFGKGKKLELQNQVNDYIAKCKADGSIDALEEKWFGSTEPTEFAAYEQLNGTNDTITVAVNTTAMPFVYFKNNRFVGYDIEFITGFANEYGYKLQFEDVAFPAILGGVQSEKYDIGMSGITITEERKESLDFSDIYHTDDLTVIIRAKSAANGSESFIESLSQSFEKTFVREQRWKLIAEGVCTTVIISVCSVLGGTVLGFGLYLLARSKTKWISKLTKSVAKVYSTIIAGTPTLVILMILFYIVFTSPDMSGMVVAIIGFILTFGAFVYDQLALTVSGVDKGQIEAAYALGYSRNQTFFRMVLPQAMRMFLPTYSGEIIGLIKATSVVGYIAVNDLTKMGDIIRGNTYEAFFPLIAVAVIYFAITWGVAGLLGILKRKAEPKRRKNENILKGVVR